MMRIQKIFFTYPLGLIWSGIHRFRRFCYRGNNTFSFHVPIISVGNLSFGGTGKTPMILWLAQYFELSAKKVMILSRGYKSKKEYGQAILHASNTYDPKEYGDEPCLLVQQLKNTDVVVGRNRTKNLLHYFKSSLPDLVLLDDGFQHLKMPRDLNIVLWDTSLPKSKAYPFPTGRLRENFSALYDADIVILMKVNQSNPDYKQEVKSKIKAYLKSSALMVEADYKLEGLFDEKNNLISKNSLKDKNILAVAGIAAPSSFLYDLQSLGLQTKPLIFKDHCHYNARAMSKINAAIKDNTVIVTTEKDKIKWRDYLPLSVPVLTLKRTLYFISGEDQLKQRLDKYKGHL